MSGTVTIRLKGGLGNQLFIYFAGAYVANKYKKKLKIDISLLSVAKQVREFELLSLDLPFPYELIRNSSTKRNFIKKKLYQFLRDIKLRIDGVAIIKPSTISYVNLSSEKNNIILDGYFQSFRYVKELSENIGSFNILKSVGNVQNTSIKSSSKKIIGVHTRRGDFLQLKSTIGVLDFNYYEKSIALARKLLPDAHVVIFGDDIEFLKIMPKKITDASAPEIKIQLKLSDVLDQLASCDCIISSNSTFSWWSSYFSNDDTILIFPDTWHREFENPDVYYKNEIIRVESYWED